MSVWELTKIVVHSPVHPMIYLELWKQARIPTLLFGAEIWSLTSIHSEKLETCQRWFFKRLFHLPDYTSNEILAIVSGNPSVVTIINQKKLYFLGRIITLPKIPDVVEAVLKSRLLDFFEGDNSSPHGFLHDIVCLLEKYELMTCMCPFGKALPCFPHTVNGNPLSIAVYSGCMIHSFKLSVLRCPK